MSRAEEKLLATKARQAVDGRARRSLESLECCHGYEVLESYGGVPLRVAICPMVERTTWVRVRTEGKEGKVVWMFEQEK